jgi:quinol-cytochrome oxidoreductase complex cytochrome b subunit
MTSPPTTDTNPGSTGVQAWIQTTGGIVVLLLIGQLVSGVLLAFYYIPSVDHAHTTVSFIEKALSSGSWIRSFHHYGSQWLALFLLLHVIRLYVQRAYRYTSTNWVAAVLMLGLVMTASATGYSLPWDARAIFSTRVAEGLLGGIPFAGRAARLWLLGGNEISGLTLSRFFALHVLVVPFLILSAVGWRIFRRRSSGEVDWISLRRHSIAGGLVFAALSIWAMKFPAPLGPSATGLTSDYLPRPGAQFLWLYQTLKYVPGDLGSIVGVVLPGLAFLVLISLPWLNLEIFRKISKEPQRLFGGVILGTCAALVAGMTTVAYLSDRRNPRTQQQLARQAAAEAMYRQTPFTPALVQPDAPTANVQPSSNTVGEGAPPAAYEKFCVNCHGPHGEGASQGALRFPPLIGVAAKPRRTADDITSLLNDPHAYGLEPPMRSFATKLTNQEKREIAEWIVRLK